MHIKRIVAVWFMLVVVFSSVFCVPAVAAGEKTFDVVISTVTAVPGDEIVFNVDVVNNPAIAAVTITFHYDKSVMEYTGYYDGLLKKDTLAEHDGYVSVVYCGGDMTQDGTLFGMGFKVKDGAQVGEYPVTIKSHRSNESLKGSFANMSGDKLLAKAIPGSLKINYDGTNCKHKFSAFEDVVPAGCKSVGVESRSCKTCGHTETRETESIGHEYDVNWTIDTVATAQKEGVMSRHCIRCDATANKVLFTEYDAKGNGFENKVGTVLAPNSWEPLELPPEVPEENEPQEEKNPTITEPDEQIGADELLEDVKEEEASKETVHDYLVGSKEQKGIFGIIFDSIPSYIYIIICVLAVLAIILCICFVV